MMKNQIEPGLYDALLDYSLQDILTSNQEVSAVLNKIDVEEKPARLLSLWQKAWNRSCVARLTLEGGCPFATVYFLTLVERNLSGIRSISDNYLQNKIASRHLLHWKLDLIGLF